VCGGFLRRRGGLALWHGRLLSTPPTQVYGLPTVIVFRDGAALTGSKREGVHALPLSRAAPRLLTCTSGAITKDKLIAHLATFAIDVPAKN
jgi:hypothetical protein